MSENKKLLQTTHKETVMQTVLKSTKPFKSLVDAKMMGLGTLLKQLVKYEKKLFTLTEEEVNLMSENLEELIPQLLKLKSCTYLLKNEDRKDEELSFQVKWFLKIFKYFIMDEEIPQPSTIINPKNYDESVINKLYPSHILDRVKAIEGYNVFSVRLNQDNNIECMVCNYSVSQTKLDDLWDHIWSFSHMKQLKFHFENLMKYHEFWFQLKQTQDQEIQIMFSYIDNKQMKCTHCGLFLKYENVLSHPRPCKNPCKGKKRHKTVEHAPKEIVYDKKVYNKIFLGVPFLEIDDLEYPIMQLADNQFICMICNVLVKKFPLKHIEEDSHIFYQSSFILTDSLKKYHQVWSSLPCNIQPEQINYRLYEYLMMCVSCNRYLDLNVQEVQKHMLSDEHIYNIKLIEPGDWAKNLKNYVPSLSSQTEQIPFQSDLLPFHSEQCASNDDLVINPKDYSQFNSTIPSINVQNMSCPLFQICHDYSLYCLICAIKVTGTVEVHLDLPEHFRLQGNEFNRYTLAKYHEIFQSLPKKIQQEKWFFAKRASNMVCALCRVRVSLDAISVTYHVQTTQHKKLKEKVRLPPKLIKIEDFDEDNEVNKSELKGTSISANGIKIEQVFAKQNEIEVNDGETDQEFAKGNEIEGTSRNDNPLQLNENLPDLCKFSNPSVQGYTMNTIKELFQDLPHSYINGVPYPIFQRIGETIQCIYCTIIIKCSVTEHLSSDSHTHHESLPKVSQSVQKYHEIFSSLPCGLQTQQIHIRRQKKDLLCCLCEVYFPLIYQDVYRHVSSNRHKKRCSEEADKNKRKSDVAYTKNQVRNFVYRDLNPDDLTSLMDMKLKKDLKNILEIIIEPKYTYFPCAVFNDKFYPVMELSKEITRCLICNVDIKECPFEHINSVLHVDKEPRLRKIRKYYDIWNSLPDHVQMQQPFFEIFKKSFKCIVCLLNLPYDKYTIKRHIESREHEENILKFVYQEVIVCDNKSDSCKRDVVYEKGLVRNFVYQDLNSDNVTFLMDVKLQRDLKRILETILQPKFTILPCAIVNNKLYPIMEVSKAIITKCLICSNNDIKEDPFEHINSTLHIGSEKGRLKTIIKYYDIWNSLPGKVLIQQPFFSMKKRDFKCNVCCLNLPYDELTIKQHIESQEHEENILKFVFSEKVICDKEPKLICDNGLDSNVCLNDVELHKDLDHSSENNIKEEKNSPTKSILEDHSPLQSLSDWDKSIESDNEEKYSSTFTDLESDMSDVNMNTNMDQNHWSYAKITNQNHQKVPTGFPPYDISIINTLFKNGLIHYNKKIDNTKYPYIQNVGLYKHCLICSESLASELLHCNSDIHLKNVKDQKKQLLLQIYHNVFSKLPKEYQDQQKYFRKDEPLKCILCSVSVQYDCEAVLSHVQLPEHVLRQEKFEKSPDTSRSNSPFIRDENQTQIKMQSKEKSKASDGSKNKSKKKNKSKDQNGTTKKSNLTIADKKNIDKQTLNSLVDTKTIDEQDISVKSNLAMPDTKTIDKQTPNASADTNSMDKQAQNVSLQEENLSYTQTAKEKLFKNLEEYTVTINGKEYFLVRNSMLGVRCMLCNDGPVLNPVDHFKTSNHIKHMESKEALASLGKLHRRWMRETYYQEHLFYIIQRHCHLCQISIPNNHDLKHINSKGHLRKHVHPKNYLKKVATSTMEPVQTETKVNEKNNKIQTQTFVNNNLSESIQVDPKSQKIVQNGIGYGQEINNHQIDVSEPTVSKEISLTYAPWVKATIYYGLASYTISVENSDYPYLRRTYKGLRCILCQDDQVDSITEHLNTERHQEQMMNKSALIAVRDFHDFWTRTNCPISQNQQIFVISGRCTLCSHYTDTTDMIEHLPDKGHRICEDGLEVDELLEAMGIDGKFRYCEEVQNTLYKDLDQYCIYQGPVKLPFLRITIEGIRCILCDDTVVTSPPQHIATVGHKQSEFNFQRRDKLWNFHKMWQRMSPAAQMHQQYVILMMCVVCDKKLSIETGEAHVLSKPHEGNVKLRLKKKVKTKKSVKHDIKPLILNSDSKQLIDQIPWYFSPHLKLLKNGSNNDVKCTICNKSFTTEADLRSHLDTKEHCVISKIDHVKNQFLCEICMRKAKGEAEWLEHLNSGNHKTCVENIGNSRKPNLKEYSCSTCNIILFGDTMSIMRHSASKNTKGTVEVSLSKGMKKLLFSRKAILDKAKKLVEIVEHDQVQSRANVDHCCRALEKALSFYYVHCRAYPFGSRVTGLGNSSSDLDVFIDIGGIYDGSRFQSAEDQAAIVIQVGELLRKDKKHFANVVTVPGARTPIVKVFHIDTEIDCDISFRHGLSVENTAFIRFCIDLQPTIKPALLFLKEWLSNTDLPYGTPTSYAFNLLFIYFMQQNKYLLSVEEIRRYNRTGRLTIDGWEVIEYIKPINEMRMFVRECKDSLPDLLKNFFGYYENLNFGSLVICPLLGRSISKSLFVNKHPNLPKEMATYVRKLSNPNSEVLKHHTPMCVQDPFDLSHNVTKGCSAISAKMFQSYCKLSKSYISALR